VLSDAHRAAGAPEEAPPRWLSPNHLAPAVNAILSSARERASPLLPATEAMP
jgi:hypothetical protein